MKNIITDYSFVVLDSSSLFFPLSDSILEEIKTHSDIYISKAFNDECDGLKRLVTGNKLANYKKNIKIIKALTLQQLPYDELSVSIDTFGTAQYFAEQKVDVLVLTANQILIHKIVLGNMQADIYDVENYILKKHPDFTKFHQTFEIALSKNILSCGEVSKGTILFKENGEPVTVGSAYNNDGSEAVIYRIDGFSNVLAKIYFGNSLTAEKFSNIKNLIIINRKLSISWCTFPTEILYYDKERKHPIGYIMKFAQNIEVFANQELYTGEIRHILVHNRDTRISFNIETCLQIVRQVLFLNVYGILVSDFNDGNFAFQSGTAKEIIMLDTDSFGHKEYFSDRRAPYDSYTRSYGNTLKKSEAIDFSYESLNICIFRLLALGVEPLFKSKFKFRQDRKTHSNDFRLSFFTENLNEYFLKIFDKKENSSIYELLYELNRANEFLKRNKSKDKTYSELASTVIYATKSDDVGENFTCVLSNVSRNKTDGELINNVNGRLQLQSKRGDISEIIHFKRNDDGTYIIAHMNNGTFAFLTAAEDKTGGSVQFSKPTLTFAQKWRIEIASKKVLDDGCEEYYCLIGSELVPDSILDVNNGIAFQLSERIKYDEKMHQHFTILKITGADYLNKTRQEQEKKDAAEKLRKEQEEKDAIEKLRIEQEAAIAEAKREAKFKKVREVMEKRECEEQEIREKKEKKTKAIIIAISSIAAIFALTVGSILSMNHYTNNKYFDNIDVAIQELNINTTNIILEMGESYQLTASIIPADADVAISYSSSNIVVSSSGLVKAPLYENDSMGGSYNVTVSAGELTKPVNITVRNSYKTQWYSSDMFVRDMTVTPLVFDNSVPNCTGFRLGHCLSTTKDEYDFDTAYLGYDWEVYTYDGQGGSAQYVGQIKMTQKDKFEYVDITFSKRDLWAVFVVPSSNIYSSYSHDVNVSNLNYNGYVH